MSYQQVSFNTSVSRTTIVNGNGETETGNVSGFFNVGSGTFSNNASITADSAEGNETFTNFSAPSSNGMVDGANSYTITSFVNGTELSITYLQQADGAVTDIPNLAYYPPDYNGSNRYDATDVADTSASVCFVSGTRIKTAGGAVEVQHLAIGDLVITASGALRPVTWLGHRTIDCRSHPSAADIMPVRIAAHALGSNCPIRDLFVSPGHAICIDIFGEVLIPAGALVNGSTIQQIEVASLTYWHVELDSHDILLAENLPCESYLEMGNRGFFREAAIVDLAAGPDVGGKSLRTHADFCRPFHADGPVVEAARARLQALAGTWRTLALSATTPAGWAYRIGRS